MAGIIRDSSANVLAYRLTSRNGAREDLSWFASPYSARKLQTISTTREASTR